MITKIFAGNGNGFNGYLKCIESGLGFLLELPL